MVPSIAGNLGGAAPGSRPRRFSLLYSSSEDEGDGYKNNNNNNNNNTKSVLNSKSQGFLKNKHRDGNLNGADSDDDSDDDDDDDDDDNDINNINNIRKKLQNTLKKKLGKKIGDNSSKNNFNSNNGISLDKKSRKKRKNSRALVDSDSDLSEFSEEDEEEEDEDQEYNKMLQLNIQKRNNLKQKLMLLSSHSKTGSSNDAEILNPSTNNQSIVSNINGSNVPHILKAGRSNSNVSSSSSSSVGSNQATSEQRLLPTQHKNISPKRPPASKTVPFQQQRFKVASKGPMGISSLNKNKHTANNESDSELSDLISSDEYGNDTNTKKTSSNYNTIINHKGQGYKTVPKIGSKNTGNGFPTSENSKTQNNGHDSCSSGSSSDTSSDYNRFSGLQQRRREFGNMYGGKSHSNVVPANNSNSIGSVTKSKDIRDDKGDIDVLLVNDETHTYDTDENKNIDYQKESIGMEDDDSSMSEISDIDMDISDNLSDLEDDLEGYSDISHIDVDSPISSDIEDDDDDENADDDNEDDDDDDDDNFDQEAYYKTIAEDDNDDADDLYPSEQDTNLEDYAERPFMYEEEQNILEELEKDGLSFDDEDDILENQYIYDEKDENNDSENEDYMSEFNVPFYEDPTFASLKFYSNKQSKDDPVDNDGLPLQLSTSSLLPMLNNPNEKNINEFPNRSVQKLTRNEKKLLRKQELLQKRNELLEKRRLKKLSKKSKQSILKSSTPELLLFSNVLSTTAGNFRDSNTSKQDSDTEFYKHLFDGHIMNNEESKKLAEGSERGSKSQNDDYFTSDDSSDQDSDDFENFQYNAIVNGNADDFYSTSEDDDDDYDELLLEAALLDSDNDDTEGIITAHNSDFGDSRSATNNMTQNFEMNKNKESSFMEKKDHQTIPNQELSTLATTPMKKLGSPLDSYSGIDDYDDEEDISMSHVFIDIDDLDPDAFYFQSTSEDDDGYTFDSDDDSQDGANVEQGLLGQKSVSSGNIVTSNDSSQHPHSKRKKARSKSKKSIKYSSEDENEVVVFVDDDSTDEEDALPIASKSISSIRAKEVVSSNAVGLNPPKLGMWTADTKRPFSIIDGLSTKSLYPINEVYDNDLEKNYYSNKGVNPSFGNIATTSGTNENMNLDHAETNHKSEDDGWKFDELLNMSSSDDDGAINDQQENKRFQYDHLFNNVSHGVPLSAFRNKGNVNDTIMMVSDELPSIDRKVPIGYVGNVKTQKRFDKLKETQRKKLLQLKKLKKKKKLLKLEREKQRNAKEDALLGELEKSIKRQKEREQLNLIDTNEVDFQNYNAEEHDISQDLSTALRHEQSSLSNEDSAYVTPRGKQFSLLDHDDHDFLVNGEDENKTTTTNIGHQNRATSNLDDIFNDENILLVDGDENGMVMEDFMGDNGELDIGLPGEDALLHHGGDVLLQNGHHENDDMDDVNLLASLTAPVSMQEAKDAQSLSALKRRRQSMVEASAENLRFTKAGLFSESALMDLEDIMQKSQIENGIPSSTYSENHDILE